MRHSQLFCPRSSPKPHNQTPGPVFDPVQGYALHASNSHTIQSWVGQYPIHILDLHLHLHHTRESLNQSMNSTKPLLLNSFYRLPTMNSIKPCKTSYQPPFLSNPCRIPKRVMKLRTSFPPGKVADRRKVAVRVSSGEGDEKRTERRSFLTLEEAGLVEMSGLSTHERFLCRLTISSLNLLRVIAEQEGCSIEELNAGKVCDWFVKDKLKREQNLESAVLKWDDSEFQF
ncbi:unnamed protein product, partial [Vitis vinifera]